MSGDCGVRAQKESLLEGGCDDKDDWNPSPPVLLWLFGGAGAPSSKQFSGGVRTLIDMLQVLAMEARAPTGRACLGDCRTSTEAVTYH